MKNSSALILIALLCVLPRVVAQTAPPYDDRPKITVNGEALVHVQPDKIIVSFGIETSDQNISAAKEKNNQILKKAVAALRELGVAEKDIQTDYLSIEPRYDDGWRRQNFLDYFVRNTFVVTLSDASKVEQVISNVLVTGVTHLHNVDFQTTEFRKYREQAREMALKAAQEKAEKMAAALGQKIGAPTQISETQSGWWHYSSWSGWGYGGRGGGMSQNVMQNVPAAGEGSIGDTIALGKISIRANVSVTFELKR